MNLATMLPAIAQFPAAIGLPTSFGDLVEIVRIVLSLAVIIGCGSVAVQFAGRSFDPQH